MKAKTKRIIGYTLIVIIAITLLIMNIGVTIHLFGILTTIYIVGFILGLFGLCWLIYKLISSKDTESPQEVSKNSIKTNKMIEYNGILYKVNNKSELKRACLSWGSSGVHSFDYLKGLSFNKYPIYVGIYSFRPVIFNDEMYEMYSNKTMVIECNIPNKENKF